MDVHIEVYIQSHPSPMHMCPYTFALYLVISQSFIRFETQRKRRYKHFFSIIYRKRGKLFLIIITLNDFLLKQTRSFNFIS